MIVAGADGCRSGWICVTREVESRAIASGSFADAASLIHQEPRPAVLAIDVPIGLPEAGARSCDREARRRLGRPRGSSVFPAPVRPLLLATSFPEGCEIRQRIEGKRISVQLWNIVPKIRQVDAVLRRLAPARRRFVREVHPEVSFQAWAGHDLAHSKKRRAGRDERLALVTDHYGADAFRSVRERHLARDVSDDDVLDAFAALWTAERILAGAAEGMPRDPPRDAEGLRMEIVV